MFMDNPYHFGSFINGEEVAGFGRREEVVFNPFTNESIGKIDCATVDDVKHAIENAHKVYLQTMRHMSAYDRSEILRKTADLLEGKSDLFSKLLTVEAGKPISESRGEVTRAIQTLRFAADGAKSLSGEQIPLDGAVGGANHLGFTKRVPIGVIAAITPFNFPLNLAIHKIAPAIAAGNTVVLKPAEKTPFSAVYLFQLFKQAGLPKGALNIVMGRGVDIVEGLVTHPFVKKVSFTGSNVVGWKIYELAGRRRVTLELGSNAPNVLFNDCQLDNAVDAIITGGFVFSGQACVAVQRIYVQEEIRDTFLTKLKGKLEKLVLGDPQLEETSIGPLITEESAKRTIKWVNEAKEQGATVITGGNREGSVVEPTVLTDVTDNMKVVCDEVFGPVVSVMTFTDEEDVLARMNNSAFGLHAGIFTTDINRAFRLADALEVSGVWINESSVRRFDHMPYGGIKNSGTGKEGVKYAIEEMTDIKFYGVKIN